MKKYFSPHKVKIYLWLEVEECSEIPGKVLTSASKWSEWCQFAPWSYAHCRYTLSALQGVNLDWLPIPKIVLSKTWHSADNLKTTHQNFLLRSYRMRSFLRKVSSHPGSDHHGEWKVKMGLQNLQMVTFCQWGGASENKLFVERRICWMWREKSWLAKIRRLLFTNLCSNLMKRST